MSLRRNFIPGLLAIMLAALAQAPPAWAAVSPTQAEGNLAHGGDIDRSFVEDGLRHGQAEIEAAQLALKRSQHPRIRAYAQLMLDQYPKINQRLLVAAKRRGIAPPQGTSVHQKLRMQRLRGQDSPRFDKRYIEDYGITGHEKAIGLIRRALSDTRDDTVRETASALLPQLERLLVQANEVQSAVESRAAGNTRREGEGGTSLPPPASAASQ